MVESAREDGVSIIEARTDLQDKVLWVAHCESQPKLGLPTRKNHGGGGTDTVSGIVDFVRFSIPALQIGGEQCWVIIFCRAVDNRDRENHELVSRFAARSGATRRVRFRQAHRNCQVVPEGERFTELRVCRRFCRGEFAVSRAITTGARITSVLR